MRRKNSTGRQVAYWRYQNKWTQQTLAARLQCLGFDISREMVANIEVGLRGVEDNWLVGFQRVFHIPIIRLFPQEVQDSDLEYSGRLPTPLPDPASLKKSQRKCHELTKQRKRA
jgi:transcriptional regulator with XRE-family HTH domain